MDKKNILVFPCGSEIALEVHRSLEHSIHFSLLGANSVEDHGKFVYNQYIGDVPFLNDDDFIPSIAKLVKKHNIDAIYPSMDGVIEKLKSHETELGCVVISSHLDTAALCLSKRATYKRLEAIIRVPVLFKSISEVKNYPVFLKPNIGYGSRGTLLANDKNEAENHLTKYLDILICEYLPGTEFTVDCFTDFKGNLLFAGHRKRNRISNGISVNTKTLTSEQHFIDIAEKINGEIELDGAWFYQVKERANGELVLMEIASRLGGSSSVYRAKGVNFASMSLFNAFKIPVEILQNSFEVEMDRALNNCYKLDLRFTNAYIDLDDTLIVDGKVNTKLISVLYGFLNKNIRLYLITKHIHDLQGTLKKFRLVHIFDEIIHLSKNDNKSEHIKHLDSIFIDDSFTERKEVRSKLGIPVFSIDMIELFLSS